MITKKRTVFCAISELAQLARLIIPVKSDNTQFVWQPPKEGSSSNRQCQTLYSATKYDERERKLALRAG